MASWRVAGFGGMIPALDDRLLPDTGAMLAENCILKAGTIVPLPKPVVVASLAASTSYAYRLPASYADAAFFPNSTWMEFDDPDTLVVRAPVIDDRFDRYYYISPEQPPKYNTRARIEAKQPALLLGIPAPTLAPGVSVSGGVSTVLETRSYVYTYLSHYGEEGPPSLATEVQNGKVDATYTITCTAPVAGDVYPAGPNRHIDRIRIYRTVTSDSGASFHLLAELPVTVIAPATVTFVDTVKGDVLASKLELESMDWSPPPSDLYGWVLMPNGFLVGWRGNQYSEVWFSVPFRPHAWPAKYTLTVEYPIVGMGVTNQTAVCCTEAYPVTMQGVDPQYISVNKLINHEPCASRGSIVSGPEGVYYASPNGLILVQPGEAENITKGIISKKSWQQLLNVPRLRAARLGMSYYAFGTIGSGIFDVHGFDNGAFVTEDLTGSLVGVVIDPTSEYVAFSMLRSPISVENCYNDPWSGEVIMLMGKKATFVDIVTRNLPCNNIIWRSKIWQTDQVRNVGAAKVFFDTVFGEPEGTIKFFVDDQNDPNGGSFRLVSEHPLTKSGELLRPPSGYKSSYLYFELSGKYRFKSVQFANTVKELSEV
jgi:hypothetical protein